MPTTPQTLEHLPLDALIPYARNSRTHSPEQIAQVADSIKRFGFMSPVLIDGEGGIIAGHGRVMAARQAGLATVPCVRHPHLTDAEKRAYIIADNKLALNAGWDTDILALELRDLAALDFDLALTGFNDAELDDLLADLDAPAQGQGDADAVPDPRTDAISQPGDVWLLGKHRVMCGDSTDAATVAVLMGDRKVDAVVTDPPYGLGKKMSGGTWATNDVKYSEMHTWDLVADQKFFDAAATMGVPAIVWGGNYFKCTASRGWLVWSKPPFPTMSDCELAWTNIDMNTKRFEGSRVHQSDGKKQHPTQKPVGLILWCFDFLKEAKCIADLFAGSGTTIIAAEQTGRTCLGMELDPHYVDVIIRRWQTYTGQRATHAATGAPFPSE